MYCVLGSVISTYNEVLILRRVMYFNKEGKFSIVTERFGPLAESKGLNRGCLLDINVVSSKEFSAISEKDRVKLLEHYGGTLVSTRKAVNTLIRSGRKIILVEPVCSLVPAGKTRLTSIGVDCNFYTAEVSKTGIRVGLEIPKEVADSTDAVYVLSARACNVVVHSVGVYERYACSFVCDLINMSVKSVSNCGVDNGTASRMVNSCLGRVHQFLTANVMHSKMLFIPDFIR